MNRLPLSVILELAEIGEPGVASLLSPMVLDFRTFADAVRHPGDSAEMQLSLFFPGTRDLEALFLNFHEGVDTDTPEARAVWRETPVSPAVFRGAMQGVGMAGEELAHAELEARSDFTVDAFIGQLGKFRRGLEPMGKALVRWCTSMEAFAKGSKSCAYLGAHVTVRPRIEESLQCLAHCCGERDCPEEPLRFRRTSMLKAAATRACGDGDVETVTTNPADRWSP